MKKFFADYAYLFTVAGIIVLLDQVTKYLVRTNLHYGEMYRPDAWITQYVRIIHWSNTGAAFGLFQNLGNVFTVLSILVSGAILYYFPRIPKEEWTLRLALGLQLGGALGNFIDRVMRGHVTDFFSVLNFPVFNIADASISLGVAVLLFGLWRQEQQASGDEPDNKEDPVSQDIISPTLPEEARSE